MKIFLFFVLSNYLEYPTIKGYFLDPKDQNPTILTYAGGNIKVNINLYLETNQNCASEDDAGDIMDWSAYLTLYSCMIKKGCENQFGTKINKTIICSTTSLSIPNLKALLDSNWTKCDGTYFVAIKAHGSSAFNVSTAISLSQYYQVVYNYMEFGFIEVSTSHMVKCCVNYLLNPNDIPFTISGGNYLVNKTKCLGRFRFTTSFPCDKFYRGPHCIFNCAPDHRKTCSSSSPYNYEQCLPGWVAIPVNISITNYDNCNELFTRSETIHMCLVLDKCYAVVDKTVCKFGYTCVRDRNNTALCAKYSHYYKNPFFNEIKNFTRTNVMNHEIVIISLDEYVDVNVSYPVFRCYWEYNLNTTEHTPTVEQRIKKNNELIIKGKKLTIKTISSDFGFDFSIYVVIQTGDVHTDRFKVDFTIIVLPSKTVISNLIYVFYNEVLNITTDGWPENYMTLILNRSDINFIKKIPFNAHFYFPNWKSQLFELITIVHFDTNDGYCENITKKTYQSTRAFEYFYWEDSDYVLEENKVLTCVYNIKSVATVTIKQIFGESQFNDISGSIFTIKNYRPGEYIIACVLTLSDTFETFRRYKMFEIHEYPKTLCIMPFAPGVGMLVKCVCKVFPPGEDDYSMILFDIDSQNIIRSTKSNFLRIPYIILKNRKYQLVCRYKDFYHGKVVDIQKRVDFIIDDHLEVVAVNFNRECMDYGTLPDEYLIKETSSSDVYIFFNQLFFLKRSYDMQLNFLILVVAFVLNDSILWIILSGYRKSDHKQIAEIYLQTEKVFRRNFMRRVNEKVTHVTPREFDMSKELFDRFRRKELLQGVIE